ncbi:MAG: 5-formyltetrahydrofolate cyclo-ligase [Clostridium sp.]|jgi:5-formyltetrahydrofolate cyclo-ligase|nr:5-formyltetrahydrofolate cyclo-ligase [Clostridium sp.]
MKAGNEAERSPKTAREEIRNRKKAIRRAVLLVRDAMPEEERAKASRLLAEHIIAHGWFRQAEELLCFLSFGSEADTTEIIEEALRSRKKVYVPKVTGEDMEFYRILSLDGLRIGYQGIREPDPGGESYRYRREEERVLLLMPGVAFDPQRRRLGYGKGFYDRFLQGKGQLLRRSVAIGFRCQLVEEIPEERQDVRPGQVVVR